MQDCAISALLHLLEKNVQEKARTVGNIRHKNTSGNDSNRFNICTYMYINIL